LTEPWVTYVPAATQAANCAAFYGVPVNVGGTCQHF
jgi:hypothetical protein